MGYPLFQAESKLDKADTNNTETKYKHFRFPISKETDQGESPPV